MKYITQLLLLVLVASRLSATTSHMFLVVQPIYNEDQSDRASWGPIDYKILDVPFLDCRYNGHPAYEAISQSNHVMTNSRSPGDSTEEVNLLVIVGISVEYDLVSNEVRLHLESAKKPDDCTISIEDAAYAALECIRIVANREKAHPKILISAPEGQNAKWQAVMTRFQAHDLTLPFTKE